MGALTKIRQSGFAVNLVDGYIEISPSSKLTLAQREFLKKHRATIVTELEKEKEAKARMATRGYCYRHADKPSSELWAIMPNATLEEARASLRRRFGDKLVCVYESPRLLH
ncbi:hypothetical protein [Methyloglobulus sp.]|uniref:hypothetical protein n=1 Tax=Methyloglobulus sp. TaxID=2518622 RepID=UPI0039897FF6